MVCIFCEGDIDKETQMCTKCKLSNIPRVLVDFEIRQLVTEKIIKIVPILDIKEQISPFGIDLTLDTKFKKVIKSNNIFIDPIDDSKNEAQYYRKIELLLGNKEDHYVLHPGEFALGQSFEYVSLPDFIVGGLDGKSSLGRLGITVHTTAASIDQGFNGHITFELFNAGSLPIILRPLQPVARLVFHLTSKAEKPYQGKYAGQTDVRSTKYHESSFSTILRRKPNLP